MDMGKKEWKPVNFEFEIDSTGYGYVKMNGEEVRGVRGVEMKSMVGEATIVKLEFVAPEVKGRMGGCIVDLTDMSDAEFQSHVLAGTKGENPNKNKGITGLIKSIKSPLASLYNWIFNPPPYKGILW